jgi:hypothetical protein
VGFEILFPQKIKYTLCIKNNQNLSRSVAFTMLPTPETPNIFLTNHEAIVKEKTTNRLRLQSLLIDSDKKFKICQIKKPLCRGLSCPTRARTWTLLNQNQPCCQLHHRTIGLQIYIYLFSFKISISIILVMPLLIL